MRELKTVVTTLVLPLCLRLLVVGGGDLVDDWRLAFVLLVAEILEKRAGW